MNRSRMVSWVLVGVAICGGAAAAETLPPGLRACMTQSDPAARLACFDRESARLAGENAPLARQPDPPAQPTAAARPPAPPAATATATTPTVASPPPPVAAAPAQSAEDKFGYRGNIARATLDQQKDEGSEQLTAKVTAVSTLPHGEMVLTLDNGQVWQQKPGDRAMRIKVGNDVTIKRGVLNSFLLTSAQANGSMRVTRVK
jgi:hypothetical protein